MLYTVFLYLVQSFIIFFKIPTVLLKLAEVLNCILV